MHANQYGELIFQNYNQILLDSSDNKGVIAFDEVENAF